MAGDLIRPADLVTERTSPVASEYMVVDNGVTVAKTKISDIGNTARPFSNQAEAEAGTSATKTMNPLTTKQAVTARIGVDIASKDQGDKADTAVQPGDLADVATSGDYDDLSGKPTLGTAAAEDVGFFATAAQGALAGTAVQPYPTSAGLPAINVSAGVHSIQTDGATIAGDGLGGLLIDTNNGSTETYPSLDGRTWYRAADLNFNRMTASVRADSLSGGSSFLSERDTGGSNGVFWKNFGNFTSGYQAVVADEVRRHMYVLQNTDTVNGPSTVTKWKLDGGRTPVQVDSQNSSTLIGHQALGLIYTDTGVRLVGATGPGATRGVTFFDYVAAGDPANVVDYQLFETSDFEASSISACVSYDQQWLVARCNRSDAVDIVRVFPLADFGAAGDYSTAFTFEFPIPDITDGMTIEPVQGIACDGKRIHIVIGGSSPSVNKVFLTYSLDGVLLGRNDNFKPGRDDFDAIASATHYEPEGLFWFRTSPSEPPALAVCMIIGGVSGAAFSKRIYLMTPEVAEYSAMDRIQLAGRHVIGTGEPITIGSGNHPFQMHGNNFESSTAVIVNWSSSGSSSAALRIAKSRGGVVGTHGIVVNGDAVGGMTMLADDGATFLPTAEVVGLVDGTAALGAIGGGLSLRTVQAATTTMAESIRIRGSGNVCFPRIPTTASAANAFLDSTSTPANALMRSTSSLVYKEVLEDVTLDYAEKIVMGLHAILYRSKAAHDRKDWSWYGLGAEEVAEIDPRLVHWTYPLKEVEVVEQREVLVEVDGAMEIRLEDVTHTEIVAETDADMIPDGVQYERIAVIQNVVLRDLMSRVAAIEAAIGEAH